MLESCMLSLLLKVSVYDFTPCVPILRITLMLRLLHQVDVYNNCFSLNVILSVRAQYDAEGC